MVDSAPWRIGTSTMAGTGPMVTGRRGAEVTASEVFHVGILVTDIPEAAGRFGSVLGLTFEEPRDINIVIEDEGTSRERIIRVAYSVEGPPFLELIESQSDGLWGHHHGEGLHHIGCWEEDLEARVHEMEARGTQVDARIFVGEHLTAVYLQRVTGARVELVGRR
jgi:catechol 2,3-dioxygenase-like lactoylglutathione lyase family enzyme